MKVKLIAFALLLATLLGVFGCTAGTDLPFYDVMPSEQPNFIGGDKSNGLSEGTVTERPDTLLNFALTNKNGNAEFQIVYDAGASLLVQDECNKLADDIKEVTDVTVPVVSGHEKKKTYEILVGNIAREEIADVKDEYRLGETQFVIRAIDTRVLVYARNEQAIITGMMFLTKMVAYKNSEAKEYGVAGDMEYIYEPVDCPPVNILGVDDNYIEFGLENAESMYTYARLSFTGNGGWRLQTKIDASDEYNDFGASQRLAYAMGEADPSNLEKIQMTTLDTEKKAIVSASDGSRVEINTERFRMDFYTPSGKLASSVTNLTTYAGGSSITGLLEEDEAIFGTGERFDSVNQRGKYIEMFSKDIWSQSNACYMVIPLLCSSRGSGVFVNLYEHMTMDLGKADEGKWEIRVTGVPMDVYIFTTEQISEVIKAYSDLSGYAKMPEEWTYGMIVCAYHPDLSTKWTCQNSEGGEGVYEMIANMEKYDLPWTGVLAEPWGGYDGAKQKDLKELCDYVHSLGKKFLVYMRVGYVGFNLTTHPQLLNRPLPLFKNSYYLTQTRPGGTIATKLPNTSAGTNNPDAGGGTAEFPYLDFSNPEAAEWFYNEYWGYLANDVGVDGCKIDFCETLPENYPLNYYDENLPTSGSHHFYPSVFCAKFFDAISSKPDSGMCYTRGGGIGAQRAPYMWAGDQSRDYSSLGFQLKAVLSSGMSGVPYMSYDMAGYQYGVRSLQGESKIFIRGTQFSAFTICLQTHGTVRRSYEFAEEDSNYLYVTELYRAYTKLHEHLTPYITELCENACATGMPVVRHPVLGWQNDKNVYGINDEFTMGDAFLIAPILKDVNVRDIYLPEGEWIDLNTGETYTVDAEGKWLYEYAVDIATLPTFFNVNTESEIAPTLVEGIMNLYDYARSVAP